MRRRGGVLCFLLFACAAVAEEERTVKEQEDGCPLLGVLFSSECPEVLDIEDCLTVGLEAGDYCEGDNECGTSNGEDNCGEADMYVVLEVYSPPTGYPTLNHREACPVLRPIDTSECPEILDIRDCETSGLEPGDLCEGDGECGTKGGEDNCDEADIYVVLASAPSWSPTVSLEPTRVPPSTFPPTTRPAASPTRPPTLAPTRPPPTLAPTRPPTRAPTRPPTTTPTAAPTTLRPTTTPPSPTSPTAAPTSAAPSLSPSSRSRPPSEAPSLLPSASKEQAFAASGGGSTGKGGSHKTVLYAGIGLGAVIVFFCSICIAWFALTMRRDESHHDPMRNAEMPTGTTKKKKRRKKKEPTAENDEENPFGADGGDGGFSPKRRRGSPPSMVVESTSQPAFFKLKQHSSLDIITEEEEEEEEDDSPIRPITTGRINTSRAAEPTRMLMMREPPPLRTSTVFGVLTPPTIMAASFDDGGDFVEDDDDRQLTPPSPPPRRIVDVDSNIQNTIEDYEYAL